MVQGVALALVFVAGGCASGPAVDLKNPIVVLSAKDNLRLADFEATAADLPGTGSGWSVRKTTLHGGKQEGVELITVDNGVLEFTVVPVRGMSVLEVRSGDVRLGWDSPVKEVVHPRHIDLESRNGLGWLEGFNEWMVRCGLEFAGHPGMDKFVDNVGNEAEMMLTLHGRIGNLPASEVEVVIDPAPPHRIRVRGVVYERRFYGPKLKLVAEVSTVPGERSLRFSDAVTNQGAFDQEFQLIYHGNFGPPILGKGTRVVTAAKKIAPMNDHAAKGLDGYDVYEGPTKGFIEQVYLFEPLADGDGTARALLRNSRGDRGVSVAWKVKELPYLTVWKNTASVEDGYVTGIEPATGYPYNRSFERKAGRVPKLAPGATRRFSLEIVLQPDSASVKAEEKRIRGIQGGRKLEMAPVP